VPSLQIIYASTSGHTEYAVGCVVDALREKAPEMAVEVRRVELVQAEDLARGDVLVLASSTWNTGGSEGQLNPHMHELLRVRAKDVDLGKKPVFCLGLGDARYHFTARALTLLEEFVTTHNGTLLSPSLKIVNEPYGQEDLIVKWTEALSQSLSSRP
jgi:flavodoxin I